MTWQFRTHQQQSQNWTPAFALALQLASLYQPVNQLVIGSIRLCPWFTNSKVWNSWHLLQMIEGQQSLEQLAFTTNDWRAAKSDSTGPCLGFPSKTVWRTVECRTPWLCPGLTCHSLLPLSRPPTHRLTTPWWGQARGLTKWVSPSSSHSPALSFHSSWPVSVSSLSSPPPFFFSLPHGWLTHLQEEGVVVVNF